MMAVHPQLAVLPLAAALLTGALLLGCAAQPARDRPFRSPTRDYPHPPTQTSDGEVVGADRMSPADKLEQGPTGDRPAPGWSLDEGQPAYDPKDRVGGHTDHNPDKADLKHDHDGDGVEDH
ncbi:MAG TPA: hypothetical protein VI197_08000 [Polyangiaceae bacterium]